MGISTHILDVSKGKPASDVEAVLEVMQSGNWQKVGEGITDADGRVAEFKKELKLQKGLYRLRFLTESYFKNHNTPSFYPMVEITFFVENIDEHFHVPLLLSAYGYSTYRGS